MKGPARPGFGLLNIEVITLPWGEWEKCPPLSTMWVLSGQGLAEAK